MGLVGALTGRRDPIADADREIVRHSRELGQANAELLGAMRAHDERFQAGAPDEDIDAAARSVVLAERRVRRAEIKRDQLTAHRAEAVTKFRSAEERRTRADAIAAGTAHAEAARKAAVTAAAYVHAKALADGAQFVRPAGDLPPIPPMILDFSASASPVGTAQAVHPQVEHFAFTMATLAAKEAA